MPARHFSSVDLPEPLRPTMPKNSPGATAKETSRSACSASMPRAAQRVQRALLERVDALVGEPEGLRDAVDDDGREGGARHAESVLAAVGGSGARASGGAPVRSTVMTRCRLAVAAALACFFALAASPAVAAHAPADLAAAQRQPQPRLHARQAAAAVDLWSPRGGRVAGRAERPDVGEQVADDRRGQTRLAR